MRLAETGWAGEDHADRAPEFEGAGEDLLGDLKLPIDRIVLNAHCQSFNAMIVLQLGSCKDFRTREIVRLHACSFIFLKLFANLGATNAIKLMVAASYSSRIIF